jgi:hypothetical protein
MMETLFAGISTWDNDQRREKTVNGDIVKCCGSAA